MDLGSDIVPDRVFVDRGELGLELSGGEPEEGGVEDHRDLGRIVSVEVFEGVHHLKERPDISHREANLSMRGYAVGGQLALGVVVLRVDHQTTVGDGELDAVGHLSEASHDLAEKREI